ncbi:LamG domain-containing protein [Streptomyces sp. NRRL F-5727]|uniref:LamG domain-containing protein n=1 Tax=Streptomyces sp. NRRL F-5727 TaxID=1463871 RepID=UPI0004CB6FD2|nr:LamG domain-containing protein [Streptomyces sp. NRRL F-5727]
MTGRRKGAGLLAAALSSTVLAGALIGVAPAGAAPWTSAAETPPPTTSAPSGSEALKKAKETGEAVEITSQRAERRQVFANPDGTFTAREYAQPLYAAKDGKWVDVDTTLIRNEAGQWTPEAATIGLAFSNGEAGEPFVTMERAGRKLSLTWPYGRLPAPHVQGDSLTYPDAIRGVDLVVRAESDGFAHLLVVKTREAAADPRLDRIELGMKTDGLKVAKTPSGALVAKDPGAGGTVFEAGAPSMWDSASVVEQQAKPQGKAAVAKALATAETAKKTPFEGPLGGGKETELTVDVEQDQLTLTPDQKMLDGDKTVFPVVIDPIPRTTSRSLWTGVMSGFPDEQDWQYSGHAGVGRCPTDYNPVSCNGVGVRRLMFTMPVSFYKGKQILGATFSAEVAHIYSATPTPEPIHLYRVGGKNRMLTSTDDWNSTKDEWSDHLQTVNQAISPTSCSSAATSANLHFEGGASGELTTEIRTAADQDWDQITFGLKAADETRFQEWKRICGNAFLSVNYNTLPRQIPISKMSSNPGGACKWGAARPYLEERPKLRVYATDPDHTSARTDKVKVRFRVHWKPAGSTTETYYEYDTPYAAPTSETPFEHTVKSSVPENTVVSWNVKAWDGDGWGPWSTDGEGTERCEFIYDSTHPPAPKVSSPEYPELSPKHSIWWDGVGNTGTFRFGPGRWTSVGTYSDVVSYRYAFDSDATPTSTIATTASDKSATVQWTPTTAGRHWVEVMAVDRAGNPSAVSRYDFLVNDGRPVVGQWNLAEKAGSTEAHDETTKHPADPGPGVSFQKEGPGGPIDFAANFDGTSGAYLDTAETVLNTARSFTVSAWVRPTALDKNMTVISQDGTGEPGFVLGYDATTKKWFFSSAGSDVDSLGEWKATAASVTPIKDQWVLLTGVYDATTVSTPELRLYVNKDLKATAVRRSVWQSYGDLQIGRTIAKSGYRDFFNGDMAEVRVFDRILPAAQVAELMTVRPVRKGYWQLNTTSPDSITSPEFAGGQPLTLAGGALIEQPNTEMGGGLVGTGHLKLNGAGAYASTATAPITGAGSFTITARVRLAALSTAPQTVLSLPGNNANRIKVLYKPGPDGIADARWTVVVAEKDDAVAPAERSLADGVRLPDTDGLGQHLAVVYDAVANEIRLYVDGQLDASRAVRRDTTLWAATRGLQVGRSLVGAPEYFSGLIDEVRVYNGAADLTGVMQLNQTGEFGEHGEW